MTKIYYFSGTGNTLWSAKTIAGKIGDSYELINIGVEAQKKEIVLDADALVLLFPAYAYGAPVLVRNFIKRAEIKTSYFATFVTYGSSPGGALAEICRILKRKKSRASSNGAMYWDRIYSGSVYWGRIPSVENYIAIFGPQKEATIKKRLALQIKATEDAAKNIIARKTNRINTFRPLSAFVSLLFYFALKIFYKHYKVSGDCDGCEICEKLCPVSAITIKQGRPYFSSKCEHCQGCLNWCPKKAIHFGRIKTNTPRYHHPEINIAELSR